MNRTALIAALSSLALASPALADDVYHCEDGARLEYNAQKNEMKIVGAIEGFGVVVPFGGAMSRMSTWSRVGTEQGAGGGECNDDTAPCVEYWQPAHGGPVIFYQLAPNAPKVDCSPR